MVSKGKFVFQLSVGGLILAAATGWAAAGIAAAGLTTFLDPKDGHVNGRAAAAFLPSEGSAQGAVLAPWGYTVHLTQHDDPAVDLSFPCGTWVSPPPAWYRFWIEGNWQISAASGLYRYIGEPFLGAGRILVSSVVRAGKVVPPLDARISPSYELRLLSAGNTIDLDGNLGYELSRRASFSESQVGVLVPEGELVAALWDPRSSSYAAISLPFKAKYREVVTIPFLWPGKMEAHLVAQIKRFAPATVVVAGDYKVSLHSKAGDLPPQATIATTDRIYAFWYALQPGPAVLSFEPPGLQRYSQALSLPASSILRVVAGPINLRATS